MHKIQHTFDSYKGSFFIELNNEKVASLEYRIDDKKILVVEHTEVDESLKGQGIGKKLLEKLVEYSRGKQLKVKPVCSFAVAVLNRTPEWQDVLS